MSKLNLTDLIVPEVFVPAVIDATKEAAIFTSGLVAEDLRVQVGTRAGGEGIYMPFWSDLEGDAEEISSGKALTVGGLNMGQDQAAAQFLGKAFGWNDLASILTGEDPAQAAADMMGRFWGKQMQKRLIASAKGVFASSSMADNLLDITDTETGAAAVIDKVSFADASFLLGDAYDQLNSVAMHTHTYSKLYKDDLIDTIKGSDGMPFPTYQGKRVFIDDTLPVTSGVYTTYLFGNGAFAYAEGTPSDLAVESFREALEGRSGLINRRLFVVHPRGVKFTGAKLMSGTAAGGRPNIADLETAGNWTRVYDRKNVRIVAFKHRVSPV